MIKKLLFILITLLPAALFAYPPKNLDLPFDSEMAAADRYYRQAGELVDSAQYVRSTIFYEKAARVYKEKREWGKFVLAYNRIALDYIRQGKYDKAGQYLEKALNVSLEKLEPFHNATADTYYSFGVYYLSTSKYSKALEYFQKVLNIKYLTLEKDHIHFATIYTRIGLVHLNLSNFDDALSYLLRGLSIQLNTYGNVHINTPTYYMSIAGIYHKLGDYEEAFSYANKALKIQVKLVGNNHPEIARCYNNLGVLYQLVGNYEKSVLFHQKALSIQLNQSRPDHLHVAKSYLNLVQIYQDEDKLNLALDHIKKVLHIYLQRLDANDINLTIPYDAIGAIYRKQGKYNLALSYYNKALDIKFKKLPHQHPDLASSFNSLGNLYGTIGDHDKALAYFQKALSVWLSIFDENHPNIGIAYENLGTVYSDQKNYVLALEYFKKSMDIRKKIYGEKHPEIASVYISIGDIYSRQKLHKQSVIYFQKALNASIKEGEKVDKYKNPYWELIISKSKFLKAISSKASALSKLYDKSSEAKDLEASLQTSLYAIDLIDSMRHESTNTVDRQILNENALPTYENCIRTATEMHRITNDESYLKAAFRAAERSKSFLLLQALRDSEAKHFAGIPDSLLQTEHDLKVRIAFYQNQLFEAEAKKDSVKTTMYQNYLFENKNRFEQLTKQLERKFPDYYRLKYDTRIASLDAIRKKLLDSRSAFLEYFWGDSTLYIFTITNNDLKINEIHKSKALENKINTLNSIIHNPPGIDQIESVKKQFTVLSHQLYTTLIPKLNREIDRLIIVPDGPLNQLSFDALITEKPHPYISFSSFPYLLKKYALSNGYSATLLINSTEKSFEKPNNKCIAFAPSYSQTTDEQLAVRGRMNLLRGEKHLNLPGAQREVEKLSAYFDGNFYFGKEASEETFKSDARYFSIIHLAMHGEADSDNPMNSRLIFNSTLKDDGVLHAYELYNLHLNARLAVLSACRTGAGKYIRGEGTMSLARAFMYSGVQSLVITLWNADDEASIKITDRFYQGIINEKTKDKALQLAKIDYLQSVPNRLAHPFFWSGFALTGNTESLKNPRHYKMVFSFIIIGKLLIISSFLFIRQRKLTTKSDG